MILFENVIEEEQGSRLEVDGSNKRMWRLFLRMHLEEWILG